MNLNYSISTTRRRPDQRSSHLNEDVHCDNEVNLILENPFNQHSVEVLKDKLTSVSQNQIDEYYFTPIRETNNTMILTNVPENSMMCLMDPQETSSESLFEPLASETNGNTANHFYATIDNDLASLFVSNVSIEEKHLLNDEQASNDVFLSTVNDLVESIAVGPPPGFENFHFEAPAQISPPDSIDFTQLLPSNLVEENIRTDPIRSSSSSHSSLTSDDPTLIFPKSTPFYSNKSSSSSSQIGSTNTSLLSTTNSTQSILKPSIPTSLSLIPNQTLSSSSSLNTSPARSKFIENDHLFNQQLTPAHHFLGQDQLNGTSKRRSGPRPLSSSTSSSSSIDEALIQLAHQQSSTMNKLFSNDSSSIFHFPTTQTIAEDSPEQAVHENLEYLASMATISTPIPNTDMSWSTAATNFAVLYEGMSKKINEICDRGFDELNTLIQEQRLIQSHLNVNLNSNSSLASIHRSKADLAKIFIIPEYFIFKCYKVQATASQIFEILAIKRPELRLRDLMFAFQAWQDCIARAEAIEKEEDMKFTVFAEQPQNYSINETILHAGFDRVAYALQQLTNRTQRARAAFQYATLNVFQNGSRQSTGAPRLHNSMGSSP